MANRDISKKNFNGTTSASNIVLLFGVFPINFLLYSKELFVIAIVVIYPIIISIFTCISIYFIPVI